MRAEIESVISEVLAKSNVETAKAIAAIVEVAFIQSMEGLVGRMTADTKSVFDDTRRTSEMLLGHAELVGHCATHVGSRDAYIQAIKLIDADTFDLREELVARAKKHHDEAESYVALMKINRQ